jgi:hypothetical protein
MEGDLDLVRVAPAHVHDEVLEPGAGSERGASSERSPAQGRELGEERVLQALGLDGGAGSRRISRGPFPVPSAGARGEDEDEDEGSHRLATPQGRVPLKVNFWERYPASIVSPVTGSTPTTGPAASAT